MWTPDWNTAVLFGPEVLCLQDLFVLLLPSIPSLKALDCFVISDEEIIEDFSLSDRFASLSRPFGVNLYQPCTQVLSSAMWHSYNVDAC